MIYLKMHLASEGRTHGILGGDRIALVAWFQKDTEGSASHLIRFHEFEHDIGLSSIPGGEAQIIEESQYALRG